VRTLFVRVIRRRRENSSENAEGKRACSQGKRNGPLADPEGAVKKPLFLTGTWKSGQEGETSGGQLVLSEKDDRSGRMDASGREESRGRKERLFDVYLKGKGKGPGNEGSAPSLDCAQ